MRPVGANSFHPEGQIDMTKLTVAVLHFVNTPKNRTTKHLKKIDNNVLEFLLMQQCIKHEHLVL
jgi:hypothetical protein